MTRELEDYIKKNLVAGYSKHEIQEWLLKNKYSASEINEAFKSAGIAKNEKHAERPSGVGFLLLMIFVTLILIVGIVFLISNLFSAKPFAQLKIESKIPVKELDVGLCADIMDTIGRSDCVGTAAGRIKNINLCDNALNKDACYNAYALAAKDSSACAKITDQNRKTSCEFFVKQ